MRSVNFGKESHEVKHGSGMYLGLDDCRFVDCTSFGVTNHTLKVFQDRYWGGVAFILRNATSIFLLSPVPPHANHK